MRGFWVLLSLACAAACSGELADKTTCGDGTHLDGSECVPDASSDADGGLDPDTAEVLDTSDDPIDADEDGYTPSEGDCDDTNAEIHPGATEICDGIDNDCDEAIDDDDDDLDPSSGTPWYADADGDGYGDLDATVTQCSAPEGYIEADAGGFDCNDDDSAFHPGADETDCSDPNDYNCDGSAAYADIDGDGWAACEECNDADPGVNPDATEVCDAVDNDCDGLTDDDDDSLDAASATTWYADADDDGFGDEDLPQVQCEAPAGHVAETASGFDCDDDDPAYHPGADETDCTDPSDYNCDGSVAFADDDDDGWAACEECDDGDPSINPDATEICNGIDDNCDGAIDDADPTVMDSTTWYIDFDGDGFGSDEFMRVTCEGEAGWVTTSTDCDDTDADVHPGATETCNGIDDDCNGATDDEDLRLDVASTAMWYADADADGFGDPDTTEMACEQPDGFTADASDCDDTDPEVHPDATEICNSIDDDCDGATDDEDAGVLGAETWFIDYDGDGFGSASYELRACAPTTGWVDNDTDCNDTDAAVNPGAIEVCDSIDNDCDGATDDDDDSVADLRTWYLDADLDGFGDADVSIAACFLTTGYVADDTDCDDANPARHPDAVEVDGDGEDNNCVNDPPSITSLSISPEGARTDDTLVLEIEDSDPDGDAVTHTVSWSVDGITVAMGTRELDGSYFSRDQVVEANASPSDGIDTGERADTSLTIANTAPGMPAISLSPAAPVPTEDTLTCLIDLEPIDADGDAVSYIFEWAADGTPFTDAVTGTRPGDTVPAASLGPIETWVCRVTPTDGTDLGLSAEASVVTAPDPTPMYEHDNGQGVVWYNEVPTGTMSSSQARLSCQASHGSCTERGGDCAGNGWCPSSGTPCWGWTSGCSGGPGRVWQYGSSYTTFGTWD